MDNTNIKLSRTVRALLLAVISVLIIFAVLPSGAWWVARKATEGKRTEWKGSALERLANSSLTNDVVRAEIKELKAAKVDNGDSDWTNEHVLLMTNGEYIVYEYRHGRNDYFPPHLFLGHGSDGRWLYSSYHFCNSMAMVRLDQAPGSIVEFAKRYSAREFDGKSDECLRLTQ